MQNYLVQLTIPGYGEIEAPAGVPRGGSGTLSSALSVGIQIFLIVVIIVSLGYLMWAGINWIRSEGDPQRVTAARNQIIYAIIGLVVALGAFAITTIIGGVLGIKLI